MCLQYCYSSSCVSVERRSSSTWTWCRMRATRPSSSTTKKEGAQNARCVGCVVFDSDGMLYNSINHTHFLTDFVSYVPGWAHSAPDTHKQCGCDRWHQNGHHAGIQPLPTQPLILFSWLAFSHTGLRCVSMGAILGCVKRQESKRPQYRNQRSYIKKRVRVQENLAPNPAEWVTAIIQILSYFSLSLTEALTDKQVCDARLVKMYVVDSWLIL